MKHVMLVEKIEFTASKYIKMMFRVKLFTVTVNHFIGDPLHKESALLF